MVEPDFITSHSVEEEVTTLGIMSSKQLWWHFHMYHFVFLCKKTGNMVCTNLLSSPVHCGVLCSEHINFFAHCIQSCFLVNHSVADQQCSCFHLSPTSYVIDSHFVTVDCGPVFMLEWIDVATDITFCVLLCMAQICVILLCLWYSNIAFFPSAGPCSSPHNLLIRVWKWGILAVQL
jgi:hypothetical protein